MRTICPKCKAVISEGDSKGDEGSSVLVCPKCRNVVLVGKEFDDSQSVSFDDDIKLAPGSVKVELHDYKKQLKRYFILLMILLVCVVAYQITNLLRNESALNATRNTTARTVLKRMSVAQEAYYADHETYCPDLNELAQYFNPKKHVRINILRADERSWAATAYHFQSPTGFTFDSGKGGFQSEGFDRPKTDLQ